MEGASTEMPRYRSHKEVWALEIKSAHRLEGHSPENTVLTFAEAGYAPKEVAAAVVNRYSPKPGDFYVVYSDGYESISPRQPFLDGYTRIR